MSRGQRRGRSALRGLQVAGLSLAALSLGLVVLTDRRAPARLSAPS